MSIWSTFHAMTAHRVDHGGNHGHGCDCGTDCEVYLSSAWRGFPIRLSVEDGSRDAHVALTREQARELAGELLAWADRDEGTGR